MAAEVLRGQLFERCQVNRNIRGSKAISQMSKIKQALFLLALHTPIVAESRDFGLELRADNPFLFPLKNVRYRGASAMFYFPSWGKEKQELALGLSYHSAKWNSNSTENAGTKDINGDSEFDFSSAPTTTHDTLKIDALLLRGEIRSVVSASEWNPSQVSGIFQFGRYDRLSFQEFVATNKVKNDRWTCATINTEDSKNIALGLGAGFIQTFAQHFTASAEILGFVSCRSSDGGYFKQVKKTFQYSDQKGFEKMLEALLFCASQSESGWEPSVFAKQDSSP
jgi:hypothetical protein